MTLALEQTLNGIQFGVMLFLLAAGLTLIFGVMRIINLAHGAFYMIGAYGAAFVGERTGSFVLAALAGLAAAAVAGLIIEFVVIRRLYPVTMFSRCSRPSASSSLSMKERPSCSAASHCICDTPASYPARSGGSHSGRAISGLSRRDYCGRAFWSRSGCRCLSTRRRSECWCAPAPRTVTWWRSAWSEYQAPVHAGVRLGRVVWPAWAASWLRPSLPFRSGWESKC